MDSLSLDAINISPQWTLVAIGVLTFLVTVYYNIKRWRLILKIRMLPKNIEGEKEFRYIKLKMTNGSAKTVYIENIYWKVGNKKIKHDFKKDKYGNIKFPMKLDAYEPFEYSIPILFYDGFENTDIANEFADTNRFVFLKALFTYICIEASGKTFKNRIHRRIQKELRDWAYTWNKKESLKE